MYSVVHWNCPMCITRKWLYAPGKLQRTRGKWLIINLQLRLGFEVLTMRISLREYREQVGTPATSPVAVVPDQPRRQRSQSLNILTSLKWMMQSPAHGHEASQDDVSGANRSLSLSLARPSPFSLQLGKRRSQMSSRELFLHIESQRILHAARIVKGQYINGKAFRAFFRWECPGRSLLAG